MAGPDGLLSPKNQSSDQAMTSTPTFPPAPEVLPFKASLLSRPAALELTRRRAMPPAFYRHTPPAPIRPDLLSGKPRLTSAVKA